ncbi:Arylsulfotransferase-domain-containing protein [Biscogniauxia marginata]|nr:Arylsulfotransferase-domain-containing protein [Biscogniauxia marginata]
MLGLRFLSTAASTFALLYSLVVVEVAADIPHHTYLPSFQAGEHGSVPAQGFFSSPIKAPRYHVTKLNTNKTDPTPYIFITGGYDGFGPSIISSKDLSLIWADQQFTEAQAHRTYEFLGQTVCAVYAGGAVRIYNQHYQLIYQVRPQGSLAGVTPDSHEAHLTHDNRVVMVVSTSEDVDLSVLGEPGIGTIINCYVQEVDPVTNQVRFQFNTLDFFRVEDSFWPVHGEGVFQLPGPADMWHMNSIEKTSEGDFLVSYRHLHSIILINGTTGKVEWCMGGKRNQFRDITEGESKADFHWQHNARFSAPNRIILFDNHNIHNGWCKERACSRGLELEIDTTVMTVKVVNEWRHPQKIISASRGGIQRTPTGNTLIAWGQNPMYTEYTADGELVMDIQRGQVSELDHGIMPVIAYRAWKSDWVGKPLWPPSIAAYTDDYGTNVYVSWNGATEVQRYVLLMSNDMHNLNGKDSIVAGLERTGFETGFRVPNNSTFARIAAVDKEGVIIGFTTAVHTRTGELIELDYPLDDLNISAKAQTHMAVLSTDIPAAALAGIFIAAGFSM